MKRIYDVDHLRIDTGLKDFASSYIINLKLPYGESKNYIRVVSSNRKKAINLPYRLSIFKVSIWPHKKNRRYKRYNKYHEYLLYFKEFDENTI